MWLSPCEEKLILNSENSRFDNELPKFINEENCRGDQRYNYPIRHLKVFTDGSSQVTNQPEEERLEITTEEQSKTESAQHLQ